MLERPRLAQDEEELIGQIQALLADPAHQGNPLREPLAYLLGCNQVHQAQLRRLIRISDGYQCLSRRHHESLESQYDRQLHRLEKLARISDRYQNSLRELSETLKQASLHDPLTGLGNRRFLMDQLTQETERANRKGAPYTLGILDVDWFKTINDRFGHEAGDIALCAIARAMANALREYDVCGRWGGEEFLIVLPETPMDFALQIAQRVCQDIKAIRLDFLEASISASLGLSIYRLGEHFSETLNRADAALLQAKANGRDRIEGPLGA
ncbi:biofilm regulation diguanylate cyclase SiaD [Simplicispira psychrophila]|uniref:biofilm regulation diguanylate cyclase SiaD n=1 Tax=Simplicispira psychrophila TaxID=80882 RepID=UPI00047F2CC6|nr:biofilm regulation diguanylate cyclase SiaD [Simplicispira psychrophila]